MKVFKNNCHQKVTVLKNVIDVLIATGLPEQTLIIKQGYFLWCMHSIVLSFIAYPFLQEEKALNFSIGMKITLINTMKILR